MPALRSRPFVSRNIPNAIAVPGMRSVVFPRAGILRRRDDHQLHYYDGMCRDGIPVVTVGPRLHHTVNELKNSALDGLRDCVVPVAGAAFLQLLARTRLLGEAAPARPARPENSLGSPEELRGDACQRAA